MSNIESINNIRRIFKYRLDYYWKALSIYAILLSIVIVIRFSLSNVKIIYSVYEPLLFLLVFFVFITSLALFVQLFNKKSISLNNESIILSTRNFTKTFEWKDIIKISFIKDKFRKNNDIRLIKIKINKVKTLKINPSYYENEVDLINFFSEIKTTYKK